MMELIEKNYLTPPDNEAIPVLKCFFCEEDVYRGQDVLNGFYCCENCLDIYFKFTAEPHDYKAEKEEREYEDLKSRGEI